MKGGFLSLQTSLSSRNFPPRAPAYAVRSFVSLCMGRVLLGGSFCRLGRWGIFAGCGFAPDLWVGCVGRVYAFRKCRLIPPHQSLSRQTACSFLPTRGEAFLTLCEHGERGKHGRYGKYHFVLWFAFAIRPHPSPSATPSPSKGKAMVRNSLIRSCFLKNIF